MLLLPALLVACDGGAAGAPAATAAIATAETGGGSETPVATAVLSTEAPVPVQSGRSIGDPYIPELGNTGYDVQRYTIRIGLDPATAVVQASTTLAAVTTVDNLTQLSLDFIGFDITSVVVDQRTVPFSREEEKLLVDLPAPVPVDTKLTLTITYSGTPVQEPSPYIGAISHLGLHYVNNESIFVLSEPDGARYWFPANDHPRDKATFRFEVTVPAGLTAVANGKLLAIAEGETEHTFIWEHNYPMAPYLATVAVGQYERVESTSPDGIPIRSYVFPAEKASFTRATDITGEVVDWMSDLFGPYPFETIGFVTADVAGTSLETQTMILLSTNMTHQRTAVHEIAHMWFGNWVSLNSWSEMWRNEGFATYVSLMWEHRDDPEGLALEMAAIESAVQESAPTYGLGRPPPQALFSFYTYFGGALMVHDLRQTVGDEAFFAGLQQYFREYGGGTASDAQFQAVMEEASGQSLDAFFARWLGGNQQ